MKKIKHFVVTRKILSVFIFIVIVGLGYLIYSKLTSTTGITSYVSSKVQRRNLVTTISGTGQVSASSQIDIKSKVSGDIIYLNTQANGTQITKGTLIAKIDPKDAEIALESAKIAYQKLIKPSDRSTMLQTESALNDAIATNRKSYEDGFNAVTSALVDFPSIINGMDNLFYSRSGYLEVENVRSNGSIALDYQSKAGVSFDKAKARYELLLGQYKNFSRTSSTSTIESFISDAYLLTRDIAEAIKNTQNAIDFVRKQKNDTTGDTPASNVATWTSTINSDLSSLLSAKTTILSSLQNIKQKNVDLEELKAGADELDIQSQELTLRQKEYDYQQYFIRAPFDGILARLSVKPTDSVSSGTIIGTVVSTQKISSITLNEVDVAKVQVGQKVKLTFDAIDGLVIDGTVNTVDLVGTVSQGVVNYNVEITHDTQDERIKSGMSVSASIITNTKEDTLTVPNSAIKTQGKINYVEMFMGSTTPPIKKNVETGISNETFTEIISGINEGDKIVIRTISPTTTKVTTPSILGTGTNRASTGSTRIPRN